MSGADAADIVAAHVRRLDEETAARLVADLWDARGYDTRRTGTVVEAVLGDESTAVGVVRPRRFGATSLPDRDVDAELVLGDAGDVAVPDDVRTFDAREVGQMLLYAVEQPVARDLCERYLGAPPDQLRPPLPETVRRRARSLAPVVASGVRVAAFVLVAVLVAFGLTALGGAGPSQPASTPVSVEPVSGDSLDRASGAAGAVAPTDTPRFPRAFPAGAPATFPPGLGPDGIDDVAALSVAHSQFLEGRSYTLSVVRSRGILPNASVEEVPPPDIDRELFQSRPRPGITHRAVFTVEGAEYRSEVTLRSVGGARARASVYHDGNGWYVAGPLSGNTTYWQFPIEELAGPTPTSIRRHLVTRYLSSPSTNATGTVRRDGDRLYRVVATGTPDAFSETFVREYRAVALVDSRGVVRTLTATYTLVTGEGKTTVRVSFSYDDFGNVTVRPPSWYDREFGGG